MDPQFEYAHELPTNYIQNIKIGDLLLSHIKRCSYVCDWIGLVISWVSDAGSQFLLE